MNSFTAITEYQPKVTVKSVFKTLIVAAFFIVLVLLFYHCPFKMITGTDCPGCGLTRAFFCILFCDFSAAIQYHPLSPLLFGEFFYLAYYQFLIGKKINRRAMLAGILINTLLILAVWLYKLFL